jgi:hypothetical protein
MNNFHANPIVVESDLPGEYLDTFTVVVIIRESRYIFMEMMRIEVGRSLMPLIGLLGH